MASAVSKFAPVVDGSGYFKGYGAVFNNTDSHRDVIARGAFRASLAAWTAKGRLPPMRLMHGTAGNPFGGDDLPVGKWLAMREDSVGLWVEGQLLALDTDQGRRLLSLMKGGVLDGLSIGYVVKAYTPGSGRVARTLTEIDLRELSLVDEPSNDLARVHGLSATEAATEAAADRVMAALAGLVPSAAPPKTSDDEDPWDRLMASLRELEA